MDQIAKQFFDWGLIWDSMPRILKGFRTTVSLMVVAEIGVLIWGLVLALARLAPGRAALPVRWLAIAYIDFFRGLPALVVLFLVGFGLPQADVPVVSGFSVFQLGALALILLYGAYVAEVYRAGIESVHWSQSAASRSLGLSATKTMRFVVLPQAIRRVVPPLLNDFIGLQKDTALVSVLGLLEVVRRAQLIAGTNFNASPYIGVAICFLVITIPMTRLVDWLIKRDQRRMQAYA